MIREIDATLIFLVAWMSLTYRVLSAENDLLQPAPEGENVVGNNESFKSLTTYYNVVMAGRVIGVRRESWSVKRAGKGSKAADKSGDKVEGRGGGRKILVGRIVEQQRYSVSGIPVDTRSERTIMETPDRGFLALDETRYEAGRVTRLQARFDAAAGVVEILRDAGGRKRLDKLKIPDVGGLQLVFQPSPRMLAARGPLKPGTTLKLLDFYPDRNGFAVVEMEVTGKRTSSDGGNETWLVQVRDASGGEGHSVPNAPPPVLWKCDSLGTPLTYADGFIERRAVKRENCVLPASPASFRDFIPVRPVKGKRLSTHMELLHSDRTGVVLYSTAGLPRLPAKTRYYSVDYVSGAEAFIVMKAFRPDRLSVEPENLSAKDRTEYLASTPDIQAGQDRIVKTAKLVTGAKDGRPPTLADAWKLTAYVADNINGARISGSGITALDVFQSKRGDCTEQSLLLTALMRASGIPARRIGGLVLDGNKLAFHAWVECYVEGRWLAVDPTLKRFGLPAAYIDLGNLDGDGETFLAERIFQLSDQTRCFFMATVDGRKRGGGDALKAPVDFMENGKKK